ncbi:M16 family metallopeptidase [Caldivirga maquilingensis]|uniref:Peptidase M16 domain protein n=1 Tax=Caldivirga maquilingensis (strain ATCC 700844 / DSM 13496 / JCM 10307 / IC-167) TaxID=397948 RepID=A8MAB8_CALMQ|nr:insulinase family protein [Caldivirga maquilingensis]ABW02495.1 peptidase M16 domain protein [Caldivirga maquilingensis IC-167]
MAKVMKISHWSESLVVDVKLNLGLVNEDTPGLSRVLVNLWKWSRGVMELEKNGVTVSFNNSWDQLTVSIKTHRGNSTLLKGLWDALTKIDLSLLGRAINEASTQVNVAREDTTARAMAEALRGLMPDSPYGNHPEVLLGVDLSRIKPEDVRKALDNLAYYSVTVVGGDVDIGGSPANPKWPSVKGYGDGEVNVKLSGKVQNTIAVAYPADSIYGRVFNYMAFNTLLGGMGLISRLYMEIRVKRGLAYYAFSTYVPLGGVGFLVALAGTREKHVNEVKELILKTTESMSTVTDHDVEMIKGNQRGRLTVRTESPEGLAQMYSIIPLYGLPEDYYERYINFLSNLKVSDIVGLTHGLEHHYIAVAGS